MSSMQQPTKVPAQIITKDEVPAYSMYGLGEARLLMTGERSNGQWWLGHFREDPGFVTPLHMHPKTDEQFYVLEGVLSVFLDGHWMEIMPGTLAIVPRGTPHAQGSFGKTPVTFLGSGNPAGFEKLFPAVDALIKRGLTLRDPELHAEMAAIGPSCDILQLGPPPARP